MCNYTEKTIKHKDWTYMNPFTYSHLVTLKLEEIKRREAKGTLQTRQSRVYSPYIKRYSQSVAQLYIWIHHRLIHQHQQAPSKRIATIRIWASPTAKRRFVSSTWTCCASSSHQRERFTSPQTASKAPSPASRRTITTSISRSSHGHQHAAAAAAQPTTINRQDQTSPDTDLHIV